ncbi:MAG: hypothetical protein L6R35_002384 [Caloplaca aegaea]|nr:MAG: hypothetical protein L6R35_002384 [Caloplaca aegaea]
MAASFDALLQADRKKRNEELAQRLLGGGRRSITPSNGVRKPSVGGSLASRIGAPNVRFLHIGSHAIGRRVALANRFLGCSALSRLDLASRPKIEVQRRQSRNVPAQAHFLAVLVQTEKIQWSVRRKENEYRKA